MHSSTRPLMFRLSSGLMFVSPGVEPDDRADVGAGAGKFERNRGPEAEADRGNSRRIDGRFAAHDHERRDTKHSVAFRIREELPETAHHRAAVRERAEAAVVVKRETHIAKRSDVARAMALDVVES